MLFKNSELQEMGRDLRSVGTDPLTILFSLFQVRVLEVFLTEQENSLCTLVFFHKLEFLGF